MVNKNKKADVMKKNNESMEKNNEYMEKKIKGQV